MNEREAGQAAFRELLLTVLGQALGAAGYKLQNNPLQQMGGRFAFLRTLAPDDSASIVFQALIYSDTAWSARAPSRFSVHLARPSRLQSRSLSQLVVTDFALPILPSANHWWNYRDRASLGKALAEAGTLLVGYGLPWLAGELDPPRP